MKKQIFLILVNIIVLSIFITLAPSITAQQQNESNYTLIINESNDNYLVIQDSKNETVSKVNQSANSTISSTVSYAEELIGEKSHEPNRYDKKAIAAKNAKKQINMESILKNILESGYNPPSPIIRISGREEQYKVPPGIDSTILVKIYVSNKPNESLFGEIEELGGKSPKYYPIEKLIKVRAPIINLTKIAMLPEAIVNGGQKFPIFGGIKIPA